MTAKIKHECDRCGEFRETTKIDMYYSTENWCQECQDASADRDPNYDAETANEIHERAWKQHRDLHS